MFCRYNKYYNKVIINLGSVGILFFNIIVEFSSSRFAERTKKCYIAFVESIIDNQNQPLNEPYPYHVSRNCFSKNICKLIVSVQFSENKPRVVVTFDPTFSERSQGRKILLTTTKEDLFFIHLYLFGI